MPTLILFDRQDVTRIGLKTIAAPLNLFQKVVERTDLTNLLGILASHPDAVAVVDYAEVQMTVERLLIVKERFPGIRWLIFSNSLSAELIYRLSLEHHYFSIVMKDEPASEITEALVYASQGKSYLSPQAKEAAAEGRKHKEKEKSPLSTTEKEILKSMALGHTTRQIAEERCLSIYTVMTHRKNIFRKLNVNNAHEAVRYALKSGIVQSAEYYI